MGQFIGKKIKRLLDFVLSVLAIIILSPIMLIVTCGIKCSSKGPVIYKATRMGMNMRPIVIYKFRTMYTNADKESSITAANDSRIFPFGNFLRKTKIDELPQLFNILQGTMSIVGPRPEDVKIVENYFTDRQKKTLEVPPGLASPGSVFNYTHGEQYLDGDDTEADYINKLMPLKLDMELYYVEHWSLAYDVEVVFRTIIILVQIVFGRKEFTYPREYNAVVQNELR